MRQLGQRRLYTRHPCLEHVQLAAHQRVIVGAGTLLAPPHENVLLGHERQAGTGRTLELRSQPVHHFHGALLALRFRLQLDHEEAGIAAATAARMHSDALYGGIFQQLQAEGFQPGHHGLERGALIHAEKTHELPGILLWKIALGHDGIQVHIQADGGQQHHQGQAAVRQCPVQGTLVAGPEPVAHAAEDPAQSATSRPPGIARRRCFLHPQQARTHHGSQRHGNQQ